MIVVADNLNTRNSAYMTAIEAKNEAALAEMARELSHAQADMINIQCSLDGAGDEESLPWVAEKVEEASGCMLSVDTRNTEALRKTLSVLKRPPLVNYLSLTEPADREGFLSVVERSKAYLVLRASKGSIPSSFEAKMQILEELLEEANSADIPNERLFLDPSIVHIGRGLGQEHMLNSHECILAVKEIIDPATNTIMWISNVSSGMHGNQRKKVEAGLMMYMAGAGLDAAMVDVLSPEIQKAIYLIRAFRDEIIFSSADMS